MNSTIKLENLPIIWALASIIRTIRRTALAFWIFANRIFGEYFPITPRLKVQTQHTARGAEQCVARTFRNQVDFKSSAQKQNRFQILKSSLLIKSEEAELLACDWRVTCWTSITHLEPSPSALHRRDTTAKMLQPRCFDQEATAMMLRPRCYDQHRHTPGQSTRSELS